MSRPADRFTALIDACCLAGALRRNMLLSLAEAEFYRVRWSDRIMDETARAIEAITGGEADLRRQIAAMERAFPEAKVEGFETLEKAIIAERPKDVGDAHVLAAAATGRAAVIVTDNLKDFPKEMLAPYGIEARSADDFIADCIEVDMASAMAALDRMRMRFRRPEFTWDAICRKAEVHGLHRSASMMREFSGRFE